MQVTVRGSAAVQPSGDETNVRPSGNGSVTTTLFAVASDTFVTVNAYGTCEPGVIIVALEVFSRVISASMSSLVTVHVALSPNANVMSGPFCTPPIHENVLATYSAGPLSVTS